MYLVATNNISQFRQANPPQLMDIVLFRGNFKIAEGYSEAFVGECVP